MFIQGRQQGPYSQHFIFFVPYELVQKARVFVPNTHFQTGLIYVGKARSLP
jgi:hypothetical protein